MAHTIWYCPRRANRAVHVVAASALLALATAAGCATAAAPEVGVAASVDRTQVSVGEQVTLTITLTGELGGASLDAFTVPPALAIVGQSRSQNVRVVGGRVERSEQLIYALLPREPGTFALGPFRLRQRGHTYTTDPLHVEVRRPVLPPPSSEPVERLTI